MKRPDRRFFALFTTAFAALFFFSDEICKLVSNGSFDFGGGVTGVVGFVGVADVEFDSLDLAVFSIAFSVVVDDFFLLFLPPSAAATAGADELIREAAAFNFAQMLFHGTWFQSERTRVI